MNFIQKSSELADRLRRLIRAVKAECESVPVGSQKVASECLQVSASRVGHEAEFDRLSVDLFAFQFEFNGPYRRFCQATGATPETVELWTQVPAIPTSAFKELDLSCLQPAERSMVFHSSGTTRQRPSRHFHNAETLSIYEDSLLTWFELHLAREWPGPYHARTSRIDSEANTSAQETSEVTSRATQKPPEPADKNVCLTAGIQIAANSLTKEDRSLAMCILTPMPAQARHSSLVHMFETIRLYHSAPESAFVGAADSDGGWRLESEAAVQQLRKACESGRCLCLLGPAFSFVNLLDLLAEKRIKFQLPTGSRVMETGGYKGRSRALSKVEVHSLLEHRLGIPPTHIVSEYGMSELSSQAYDQVVGLGGDFASEGRGVNSGAVGRREPLAVNRQFSFPPWARVHVVSPETGQEVSEGETGLIRVFDLANVFSVMAVQTEDLGVRRGNGWELIGRAELAEPRGCSLMAV